MNFLISANARQIIELYGRTKKHLANEPTSRLHDLAHEAASLDHHQDFSIRTGAEITRAACLMLVDERTKG